MKKSGKTLIFILFIVAMITVLAACIGTNSNTSQVPSQSTIIVIKEVTSTPQPVKSGFQGVVLNTQTSQQVNGVYIIFKSLDGAVMKDTFSDATGRYQIDLPPGRYRVITSHEGYQTLSSDSPIEISGTYYSTYDITLTPKGKSTVTTLPTDLTNYAGVEYKGFYWYFGDDNLSCEAVCRAHGGYSEGTQSYTGSSGASANCSDVLLQLGISTSIIPPNLNNDKWETDIWETSSGGLGCYTLPYKDDPVNTHQAYWDKDPTTAQAVFSKPGFQRVCACQK